MGLSLPHLLVVLTIVILVFGTKRLKTLGGDLGDAIKGFRSAVKDGETHGELVAQDSVVLEDSDIQAKSAQR